MFIIYQVHLSSNKGYAEALKKKSMAPILYDDTCLHVIRWRFWRQFNDPDNGLAERLWMNDDDDDGHDWMKWRPPSPPGGLGPSLVNGRRPLLRQKLSLPPISTSLLADTKTPPQVPWRCHPRFPRPSKNHFLLGYKLFSYQDHYSWPIKNNPFLAFLPPSEIPATE